MTENKIRIGQVREDSIYGRYTVTAGVPDEWTIKWESPPGDGIGSGPFADYQLNPDRVVVDAATTGSLGAKAAAWLRSVAEMLEQKAAAYGDSAGNPIRVFTTASPIDMLLIRAEDKLSRLVRGSAAGEDTVADLVGYLALLAAAGWKGKEK